MKIMIFFLIFNFSTKKAAKSMLIIHPAGQAVTGALSETKKILT